MNMQTSPNDISNKELLKEFRAFSKQVIDRFDGVDARLDGVDARLDGVDARFDKVDARFDGIDKQFVGVNARLGALETSNQEILEVTNSYANVVDERLGRLEREQTRMSATMVTKDYLDDKLANLRSDIYINTAKQIEKAIG